LKSTSRRASGTPRRRPPEACPTAPKARGELAEARFLAKAMALGLVVSKPFGDSARYDFVVDAAGCLSRVQVKSAWTRSRRGDYQFGASPAQLRGQRPRPYRRNEIDFLAACIVPEDAWFIIPIAAISTRNHFMLTTRSSHPFARYREAWELLECPGGATENSPALQCGEGMP